MTGSSSGTIDGPARSVALIDLKAQAARLGPALDTAIAQVLAHGQFINGPEVAECERRLADFCGARHVVATSSGTDALLLVLMAYGVGPGDGVICPSFTFASTAEAIALTGATPIFADVSARDYALDPAALPHAAAAAERAGLRLRGIIAVDLFGQPADYAQLRAFADTHALWLMADAAQSFGARYQDQRVGTLADATATSFFPSKPLGCYGDGGAIITNDEALAEQLLSLREHGRGDRKYRYARIGLNARLDTLQAAILLAKLAIFDEECAARVRIADRYRSALAGCSALGLPEIVPERTSVYAQFTLRLPHGVRDRVAEGLRADGIATAVYYPEPLHHQPAYREAVVPANGLAISERLCHEVLSVPFHPYLSERDQDRVIDRLFVRLGHP